MIRERREELLSGKTITVKLSPKGFNRRAVATIEQINSQSFWINEKSDPTWFSARIRAAACALFRQGYFGRFEIAHNTGVLTIRCMSLTPPVPLP
jgi:hypothetical protein